MPKGKTRPFTSFEEWKIKQEFLIKPIKTLASEIGVGQTKVRNFLKKNGLVIPPDVAAERRKKSQFKKGMVSWNKGKKPSEYLTAEAQDKMSKTQFKKGRKPHNTKYDGCIVIRRDKNGFLYKYIRLSKGNWALLHRYNWEQANGKIEPGMIISFVDGNTLNCEISNLEILSMEQNMLRNSKHNFPDEIVPTMALISKLEKSIKSKSNGKK